MMIKKMIPSECKKQMKYGYFFGKIKVSNELYLGYRSPYTRIM